MFSLLHVDNNFFYREIIHALSLEKDFQYFSAKSPERAYEIIQTTPIDVIVTGLEFKDVDEVQLVKSLIALKQNTVPLIVLSAYENDTLKEYLFELGITEFISKKNFVDYLQHLISKLEYRDIISTKLKSLRICVLDDDRSQIALIKKMLHNNDIHNASYYSHSKALLSSDNKYDLYLIDFILPDISGETVIAKVRAQDEYAVIIAMSSLTGQSVISNLLLTGADDFISKPLQENLFIARLKANIRTYSLMAELREKNTLLNSLATQDGLTGLYNRNHILHLIEVEMERSQRSNLSLSIVMFDIDYFKKINDTYGHHAGDVVLFEIGKMWNCGNRKIDFVGRYGGEEFIVLLPETNYEGAKIYAERLRETIEKKMFGKEKLKLTISGGVATYMGETVVELLKKADKNLYQAKSNGRNRIE